MARHAVIQELGSGNVDGVRIQLLGGFRVILGERIIKDSAWRLRKAASLFKLLALSPTHQLHRERMLELLWPDLQPRAATNTFHRTLHVLRRILEPDHPSTLLRLQDDILTLDPPVQLWVDVHAFEAAADTARRARDPAPYYTALALYTGELLPADRYEDWATSRREDLHGRYVALLLELARLHEARQELAAAMEALRRAVEREPAHEEAHTGLMRLYARSGQRHQALRQYRQLKEALVRELDADPEPASERLYQEIRSGQFPPSGFQPATAPRGHTESTPWHNLPIPLTSFIGREHEVAEVSRLLGTTRLLTVIGTGGCGKTRLALEVARGSTAPYVDGVWLVELAGLSDPRLVPSAVAGVLGVREDPDRPLIAALTDVLRSRQTLLVLDNCEHLLDACAHLAEMLLSSCPGLRVLATSRGALGARGELHWRVPSLSMPPVDPLPPVEQLSQYGSVRLFVERARQRQPGLDVLTAPNAQPVVEICRQLDGLPLAIELATSWIPVLSVQQIATRLSDALRLLTGGDRTVVPRQRTLRGVLDWSYAPLSEPGRDLFACLSVFAGGWTLEAAEAVGTAGTAGSAGAEDVLEVLSRLVDNSLVQAEVGHAGVIRYRLLEPIRQYARERLEERGGADAAHWQHAAFFLALAEAAQPELTGPRQVTWLRQLETEHDNLRAALRWSRTADGELGLRLAAALWRFWYVRGHLSEGREWLEAMLSRNDDVPTPVRAEALRGAGGLAYGQTDYERAVVHLEQALSLYSELGDWSGVATCLNNVAVIAHEQGGYERSREVHEQCLALRRQLGDTHGIGQSVSNLGSIYLAQGEYERAQALFEEGVALDREVGDESGIAIGLNNLAEVARHQGDFDRAVPLYLESLAMAQRVGEKMVITSCLEGLASAAHAEGWSERAARLYGAAKTLREAIGRPVYPGEQDEYERRLVAVRAALGEDAFAATWADGQAMTLEHAITYALSLPDPASLSDPPRPAAGQVPSLTRREREIVGFIAQGLTNRQIAHQLVLSERTVDTHCVNIMRKLGLHARAQVADWALHHGFPSQP